MYRSLIPALALTTVLWAGAFSGTAGAQDSRPRPPATPAPAEQRRHLRARQRRRNSSRPPRAPSPQEAPPSQQPPPPADSRRRQRPAPEPAPAGGSGAGGGKASSGRISTARSLHPARVPVAGRRLRHRSPDLSVLHPGAGRAGRRMVCGCPTTRKPRRSLLDDFQRLWATNFLEDLSIEVVDDPYPNGVIGKRIIYKMEERQRVKIVDYDGQQEGRAVEDRREAEGREHPGPPRYVHRSRNDPARRGCGSRPDVREGLPVRRGHARPSRRCRAVQSSCTSRSTSSEGPKVKIKQHRLRWQQGAQRRGAPEADEGEPARALVVVHHRARHLPGIEVRGRRRARSPRITATRVISAPASARRKSRSSTTPRTARRGTSS